jgi:hypothetical protein
MAESVSETLAPAQLLAQTASRLPETVRVRSADSQQPTAISSTRTNQL